MFRLLFLILTLFIPNYLFAAVTINEVAWMGSVDSANDEWIELYNDGNTVSLDGWVLSDGLNLNIPLSGSIGAGTYAILERTDDNSAPGSAFLIYSGALGNDGRTLTLKRSDGGIEDQVVGGADWQNIGGDNSTKETAQYSTTGWVTGPATAGARNITTNNTLHGDNSDVSNVTNEDKKDSSKNEYISLVEPDNELQLSIEAIKTGYVNQPVTFTLEPSGLGEAIMDSLHYTWNFGNLSTSSGREVQTIYNHPGTYVIVVEAAYTKYTARARHTITIVPTTISLLKNKEGDILVQNNAHYEADVSGFTLKGDTAVVFPPYTFLAPKSTMVIPAREVSIHEVSMVALYDRGRKLIASTLTDLFPPVANATEQLSESETEITSTVQARTKQVLTDSNALDSVDPVRSISATATTKYTGTPSDETIVSSDGALVTTAGVPTDKLPYLGLMGLIIISILALYSSGYNE